MVIVCPACQARYRINPSASKATEAKVKCPGCEHVFNVSLVEEAGIHQESRLSGQPVVMVVDDARFFREMIKDILKDLPIEIVMVADGNEAWQQITTLVPQLVLLDLNIPGKNGKEILQSMQKSTQLEHVKVLAMSGVERGDETAAELRRIGADDFISKSFKPRELQDRVRSILGL
ncbi:MAG: zinc-ribbon domain-containing protein [Desulfuromonadales bacterium]|nr:zinc-ribbon domain-containing protein [Desulfuromonadales bacterium]